MRLTLFVLLAAAAFAQRPAPKTDVGTNVKQPVVDFYDSMSDYFRQGRRAIDLIAKKGIPDEEIPAVLTIARRSSASPNQVIDARKAGKSFDEITLFVGGTRVTPEAVERFQKARPDCRIVWSPKFKEVKSEEDTRLTG